MAAPRTRDQVAWGRTTRYRTGCGHLFVTVNSDEAGLAEVITHLGKAGGCPSQSEALGRVVSIAIRAGVEVAAIQQGLCGVRCFSCIRSKREDNGEAAEVLSCPDAIGRALGDYLGGGRDAADSEVNGGRVLEMPAV